MTAIINQVFNGMVSQCLESTWGAEWIRLSASDQNNILRDFIDDTGESTICSPNEYVRRIYRGNLQAYANTLTN